MPPCSDLHPNMRNDRPTMWIRRRPARAAASGPRRADLVVAPELRGVPLGLGPPLVRRVLRAPGRGLLPRLLAPVRRQVEQRPGVDERLGAAPVRVVGPEHPVAVADEDVDPEAAAGPGAHVRAE